MLRWPTPCTRHAWQYFIFCIQPRFFTTQYPPWAFSRFRNIPRHASVSLPRGWMWGQPDELNMVRCKSARVLSSYIMDLERPSITLPQLIRNPTPLSFTPSLSFSLFIFLSFFLLFYLFSFLFFFFSRDTQGTRQDEFHDQLSLPPNCISSTFGHWFTPGEVQGHPPPSPLQTFLFQSLCIYAPPYHLVFLLGFSFHGLILWLGTHVKFPFVNTLFFIIFFFAPPLRVSPTLA